MAREVQLTRAEVERRIRDAEARGITGNIYKDAYGIVRVNTRKVTGDGVRRPGEIIPDTGRGRLRPGEILPDTLDPWVERSFEEQKRRLELERLRKEQLEQEKRIKQLERRLANEKARNKKKNRNKKKKSRKSRKRILGFKRPRHGYPSFAHLRRGRNRGHKPQKPQPIQRKKPQRASTPAPPRRKKPSKPKRRCKGLIGCWIDSNRRVINKVKERLG